MKIYQTNVSKLAGTDYREVLANTKVIYSNIKKRSKRKPYIRSEYFNKEKIFLDYFWEHLYSKNSADRFRRLKFYACAIDLLKHSKYDPFSVQNPNHPSQTLYRFFGKTKMNEEFIVQVAHNKKNNQKYFTSVFPSKI